MVQNFTFLCNKFKFLFFVPVLLDSDYQVLIPFLKYIDRWSIYLWNFSKLLMELFKLIMELFKKIQL